MPKQERKQGYIVVTADKGMAGAYNHNVIKIAEKEALSDNKNMLFVVGQVGRKYFEKRIFLSILTSNIQLKILMLTEQELSANR